MAETNDVATGAEVRQWARDNGHEVADKGRLSGELKTAFTESTGRATS